MRSITWRATSGRPYGGVVAGGAAGEGGGAMQVTPMKRKLKPPETNRLKLMWDIPGSNSAFEFNLRRYKAGGLNGRPEKLPDVCYSWWAGAYTRPLLSSI